ncbi:hypothetical protein ACFFLS_26065 [Flavobacterium procerum]|uniref:Uncharacterized protein n=1 Tax=Flavobacterium procerum TaxID=1455569 RepID=A0ABV6C109_9FLAO
MIGLVSWLFIGIINKSEEFYEPELCLKYPTLQIKFNKPDLSEDSEISKMNKEVKSEYISYTNNYNLNEKLGYIGEIVPYIILQLFLSVFFNKFITNYSLSLFFIDFFLFIISFTFLCSFLTLGFFYYKNIILYILGVLLFNLMFNFFIRNLIVNKKHNE